MTNFLIYLQGLYFIVLADYLNQLEYMKWSRYNTLFYSKKIGYCLFNSRMLSLTKLDKQTYDMLYSIKSNYDEVILNISKEYIAMLTKNKILVHSNEDNNYLNMLKYRKQLEAYTSRRLSLVVCPTLSCNFACPYCYEHNLTQSVMHRQTQKELIKFINNRADHMDSLALNWHGGEPLIAFSTIRQIYSLIEDLSQLPIGYSSMASNGYLLNEDICIFLESKHLNYLQITIDGNKQTHNKTRILKNGESSFEKIIKNIDMATELMPNCHIGVRTNIGRGNIKEYTELFENLSSRWKNKNLSIYHAYILDNGLNTCSEKRCALELSTNEKNDFEIMLAKKGINSKKSLYPKLRNDTHTCGDCNAYVIDPRGLLYKCWADVGIESRSIGSLSTGINKYDIVSQFMVGTDKFADEKCLKCSYLPICDGGCNLYRVGKIEKKLPYDVCEINEKGLIKYLETYCEAL